MVEATTGTFNGAGRRSVREERVHCVRLIFCVIGLIVCICFAFHGAYLLRNFNHPRDFEEVCRWIVDGGLCLLAGLAGCLLEIRALVPGRNILRSFRIRIVIGLFYIWLGAYMVGQDQNSDGLGMVWFIAGIASWVVAMSNILTSCCPEFKREVEASGPAPVASATSPANEEGRGGLPRPAESDAGADWPSPQMDTPTSPWAEAQQPFADQARRSSASSSFTPPPKSADLPVQWNTYGGAFGAAR